MENPALPTERSSPREKSERRSGQRFDKCLRAVLASAAIFSGCSTTNVVGDPAWFEIHLRSRDKATGHPSTTTVRWDPPRTAFIVCDMWDDHWCRGAAVRVGELAPAVNELLRAARRRGAFIIHAPSTTVEFYKDTPARRRARDAPFAAAPWPLSKAMRWGTAWCWPDKAREPDLPIDDSDMGCDCARRCAVREAWSRQASAIEIDQDRDAITDDGQETVNLLVQRRIENVVLLGVHLNMCVLGRPFGIRQMAHQGRNVALVRDLTDTMYNPRKRPFVNHFAGTVLVVEHVERYWCPSFESSDLTGGRPFRFRGN